VGKHLAYEVVMVRNNAYISELIYLCMRDVFSTIRKQLINLDAVSDQTKPSIAEEKARIQKSIDADDIFDLEKAEGSRGGNVIGHTKSGKPIYEDHTHESHKKFTSADHKDAAKHQLKHEWKLRDMARDARVAGDTKKEKTLMDKVYVSSKNRANVRVSGEYARAAAKGFESDIEKGGGEGSRGGKISGHTKAGKPIYEAMHKTQGYFHRQGRSYTDTTSKKFHTLKEAHAWGKKMGKEVKPSAGGGAWYEIHKHPTEGEKAQGKTKRIIHNDPIDSSIEAYSHNLKWHTEELEKINNNSNPPGKSNDERWHTRESQVKIPEAIAKLEARRTKRDANAVSHETKS